MQRYELFNNLMRPTWKASRNEASKLLHFRFYLTRRIIMYVYKSQMFPQISVVSKLTQSCCTLTLRSDIYWVWFAATLLHRNVQVAAIAIDWIQLRQDIWVLTWRKLAYFNVPYKKVKTYKHRIWKLRKNFCCTLFWQIKYSIKYSCQW